MRYSTPHGRTVLRLTAVGLLVAGLTLGAVALASGTATASISAKDLAVSDGAYRADGANVSTPHLLTSGELSFSTDSTPDGWTVALQVAPAGTGNYETVGTTTGGAISSDMALSFDVRGALTDHSAFSSSDFAPDRNSTVSHDVDVRVVLTVEADGATVVTANATDTATVTIENTLGELSASIAEGDGYWLFQSADDASTPTATPSP